MKPHPSTVVSEGVTIVSPFWFNEDKSRMVNLSDVVYYVYEKSFPSNGVTDMFCTVYLSGGHSIAVYRDDAAPLWEALKLYWSSQRPSWATS